MTIFDWSLYWHAMTTHGALVAWSLLAVLLAGYLGQELARDRGWTDFRAVQGQNLEVRAGAWEDGTGPGAPRPLSGDPAGVTSGAPGPVISPWETLPPR